MAYEDRILRMVRQPRISGFNDAKDQYRARTRGGHPGRRYRSRLREGLRKGFGGPQGLEGRGLGSFENQMMMDQLRGPAGMNLANKNQPRSLRDLLKRFKDPYMTPDKFGIEPEDPYLMPIPRDLGGAQGEFLGNTGYSNDPYYELGTGIIYDSPGGGTSYNVGGMDAGDILRPVEKRQFDTLPSTLGPFGDARDVNPNISVDYGEESGFTMPGDPVYGKQLDAFNDYVLNDPRQEPLDDYATPPPAQPSSNIINALRNLFGYSRGGIASLKI